MITAGILIWEALAHLIINLGLFLAYYVLLAFIYTVDFCWDCFYRIIK
jgi:hypothetical protein